MKYGASPLSFHLELVGKIALFFSAVATIALVALLHWVGEATGPDYGRIIGAQLRTAGQLTPALWFFSLLIAALTGLATWMLALYASFRIAGPLYRFARNIEAAIERGPVTTVAIRRGDLLQRDADELALAVRRLDAVYVEIGAALDAANASADGPGFASAVARAREVAASVRI